MNVGVAPKLFYIMSLYVHENRGAPLRFALVVECVPKTRRAGLFETRPYRTQDDLMLLLRLYHSVVFHAG
jgi:hypothetical protein